MNTQLEDVDNNEEEIQLRLQRYTYTMNRRFVFLNGCFALKSTCKYDLKKCEKKFVEGSPIVYRKGSNPEYLDEIPASNHTNLFTTAPPISKEVIVNSKFHQSSDSSMDAKARNQRKTADTPVIVRKSIDSKSPVLPIQEAENTIQLENPTISIVNQPTFVSSESPSLLIDKQNNPRETQNTLRQVSNLQIGKDDLVTSTGHLMQSQLSVLGNSKQDENIVEPRGVVQHISGRNIEDQSLVKPPGNSLQTHQVTSSRLVVDKKQQNIAEPEVILRQVNSRNNTIDTSIESTENVIPAVDYPISSNSKPPKQNLRLTLESHFSLLDYSPLDESIIKSLAYNLSADSHDTAKPLKPEDDTESEDVISPLNLRQPVKLAVAVPMVETRLRVQEALQTSTLKRSVSRNSQTTTFIVDVPEMGGIGPDGNIMVAFNKPEIKKSVKRA